MNCPRCQSSRVVEDREGGESLFRCLDCWGAWGEGGPSKIAPPCTICNEVGGPLVECSICGMRKHPLGRDPGIYAANGYCGHDCPGYTQEPRPGGLWPGERYGDSLGHMDWHEAASEAARRGDAP